VCIPLPFDHKRVLLCTGPLEYSNNVHYYCDNITKYCVTLYGGDMYLEK